MCVFTAVEAEAEASGPEVRIAGAEWELSPSTWKAEAFPPPTVKGKLGSSGAVHCGSGNVLEGTEKQNSATRMENKLKLV